MNKKYKEVIYAVHERDLDEFLKKEGLYEDILNEKIKCVVCGKTITIENFGGIYYKKGKAFIVCDSIECISKIEVK